MRRAMLVMFCGLGLIAPPGAAAAGGGPVTATFGGTGVSAPGDPFTFVSVPVGQNTLVEQVGKDGGAVEDYSLVRGFFGVPVAAYDGSSTGLSKDGRTLVLAGMNGPYPPTRTQLLVLNGNTLRPTARIALPGVFAVDAISPTGRWLYLIHYRSPANPNDYEVRAYDVANRKLLAKPVVDPREPSEKMRGYPVTRIMSANGRWAYTLYDRGNQAPFIHALDTTARRAFCVDLPPLSAATLGSARLSLQRGTLEVKRGDTPLALMDTRTFAVRRAPPQDRRRVTAARRGTGVAWALGIAALAAFLALVLLARRSRRAHAPTAPAGGSTATRSPAS